MESKIFICKMLSVNGHNKPVPREGRPALPTPTEFLCLVRATLRSKKISTVVCIVYFIM